MLSKTYELMGSQKNLRKLFSNSPEMTIYEITNVLNYFGFELLRIKGSHYHFYKFGIGLITIPVHQNKVGKYYLKYLKKIILSLANL